MLEKYHWYRSWNLQIGVLHGSQVVFRIAAITFPNG